MDGEKAWHVVLLVLTLFGVGSLAILGLAPLVFEEPPASLARARPILIGIAVAAVLGLLLEWKVIH
ncbi:MAG: hypothetical protein ABR579_00500 [Actinomycetota bacterium]